jgi:glutathione peroxidase-family protein
MRIRNTAINVIFFFSVCQEPGTNAEIKKFAQSFKVQFDMFEKVDVNGSNAHPVWVYLKAKQGGLLGKHRFTSEQNFGIDGLTD